VHAREEADGLANNKLHHAYWTPAVHNIREWNSIIGDSTIEHSGRNHFLLALLVRNYDCAVLNTPGTMNVIAH